MRSPIKSLFNSLKRNGSALALSGASQVVNSLTNFGIVLYLVRVLEKEDFGLYSLGFASYLVVAGILAAVFAVQYIVNNPDRAEHEKRSYAMHHVVAVTIICAVIVLMVAVLKAVLLLESDLIDCVMNLSIPVALAVLGFATRDMVVRIAYVERKEWLVLGSAITVAATAAFAFLTAYGLSVSPNVAMALGILALSQLAGAVMTLTLLDLPWRQLRLAGLRQAFVDSWKGGRWLALTSIVYHIRSQAHNFIILPILGLAALADVNAARVLLTPAMLVIPPLYQVVMPRLAERRSIDPAFMQRTTWITVGGLVTFALLYSAALLLVLDLALPLALGQNYANLGPMVMAWCAFTVFLAARNGLSMGLEVCKGFRTLLAVNTVAALIAVMLAAGLSMLWGGLGAVWALVSAELCLCLLLCREVICTHGKDNPASTDKTGTLDMAGSIRGHAGTESPEKSRLT